MKWIRRASSVLVAVLVLVGLACWRPAYALTESHFSVGDPMEAFDIPCSSWFYGSSPLELGKGRGFADLTRYYVDLDSLADVRAAANMSGMAWGQGWDVDNPAVGRTPQSLAEVGAQIRCLSLIGTKVNDVGFAAMLGSNGALSKKIDALSKSVENGVDSGQMAELSNSIDTVHRDLAARANNIDSSLARMAKKLESLASSTSPGDSGDGLTVISGIKNSVAEINQILASIFSCPQSSFRSMGVFAVMPATVNPKSFCFPSSGFDGVRKAVEDAKKAVEEADKAARAAAADAGKKLDEASQKAGEALKSFWDKLTGKEGLSRLEQAARDAAQRAAEAVENAAKATQKGIDEIKQGIQGLKDGLDGLGKGIKEGFKQLGDSVGRKIDGLGGKIDGLGGHFSGPGLGSGGNGGGHLDGWRRSLSCMKDSVSTMDGSGCSAGPVLRVTKGVEWRPFAWCDVDVGWSHVESLMGALLIIGATWAAFSAVLAALGISFRMGGASE